jgi:adenylate cyclase
VQRARAESNDSSADFALLVEQPAQTIRGLEQPVGIWTCAGIDA